MHTLQRRNAIKATPPPPGARIIAARRLTLWSRVFNAGNEIDQKYWQSISPVRRSVMLENKDVRIG